MAPKPIGRTTSVAELAVQEGVQASEIERLIPGLFPDFAKRRDHKLQPDEVALLKQKLSAKDSK